MMLHCVKILYKQIYLPRVCYITAVKLSAMGGLKRAAFVLIKKMKYNEFTNEVALASLNIDLTTQFLETIPSLKIYKNPYSEFLQPLHSEVIFVFNIKNHILFISLYNGSKKDVFLHSAMKISNRILRNSRFLEIPKCIRPILGTSVSILYVKSKMNCCYGYRLPVYHIVFLVSFK